MNNIQNWLNGDKNYNEGIALFELHGRNANMLRIFKNGGATNRNRQTLAYELGKIARQMPSASAVQSPKQPKPVAQAPKPIVISEQPSETYQSKTKVQHLIEVKNRLFKEYVAIFHNLESISTNDERKKMAIQCLQIWDEIAELWRKINYLEVHGTLPPEKMITKQERSDINQLDKAKLLELRNNSLRPGVSRYKRLLTTAKTEKSRLNYENLKNQYQVQLNEVEQRLREI